MVSGTHSRPRNRKFLLTTHPEMWTAGKVDRRDEKATSKPRMATADGLAADTTGELVTEVFA
jgi:hypothetical protein